jgi:NitT/TauT family transport system ATP-binding protein
MGNERAARVTSPSHLALSGVGKTFGHGAGQTVALGDIELAVREGEFLAIVGPSGCGKSTLLQIAAGLALPTRGTVRFDGQAVTAPPPGIVYLFQQYGKSLFPWRTVLDNVVFAIEHRAGMRRADARASSRRYLDMVGLADFADHFPAQLSGGMQQRVTIARALAAQPRVLLMDEPFSSVDALTRIELHALVQDLWQKHGFTAVLVTHDVDEAVFLADRIAVLSARPSRVVNVLETGLPRPRDRLATPQLPCFLALRHELLATLLGQAPTAPRAEPEGAPHRGAAEGGPPGERMDVL